LKHHSEILIELFKRGDISQVELSKKQKLAFKSLMNHDKITTMFGGGAGGGKSWMGCEWLFLMANTFPGTRYFIGRKELKRLKQSTFVTWKKVCKSHGFKKWRYNNQDSCIILKNGSQIDLLDLVLQPRDDEFERLGSIEYTAGWIEEGGEVMFDAYDTLKSRVNRHLNDEYKIPGSILITTNPKKNWEYTYFYKPFKSENLDKDKDFIQSLAINNPYLDKGYIEKLENLKNKSKRQRLLLGNWEYDDDPMSLIESYDKILDIFNSNYDTKTGKKYITCDAARFGSDKAITIVWDGYTIIDSHSMAISKTTQISDKIKAFQVKYSISNSNTVVDADGVGGGVVDEVGCKGFVNNGKPIRVDGQKEEFDNIKSQCGFKLADLVNEGKIINRADLEEIEIESIKEELEQLKRKDSDKKQGLIKKDDMKKNLGRSPDWMDNMIMRMFFDLDTEFEALL